MWFLQLQAEGLQFAGAISIFFNLMQEWQRKIVIFLIRKYHSLVLYETMYCQKLIGNKLEEHGLFSLLTYKKLLIKRYYFKWS